MWPSSCTGAGIGYFTILPSAELPCVRIHQVFWRAPRTATDCKRKQGVARGSGQQWQPPEGLTDCKRARAATTSKCLICFRSAGMDEKATYPYPYPSPQPQKEYHIIMEIQQIALLMQTHRLYFQIQVLELPLNRVMQLLLLV